MIKKISHIKNFGVYQNYTTPTDIKEFGVKNLIYGWNYSGKTSLSRLFAQIGSKTQNPELKECSFSIETDSGKITEQNFQQSSEIIKVFNADFVRDNLNFSGEKFKPIIILGQESEQAQREIDVRLNEITQIESELNDLSKKREGLETDISKFKTNTAATIKKTLGLVEAFDARHLDKYIYDSTGTVLLSDIEQTECLKNALASEKDMLPALPQISISPSIDDLHQRAISTLDKVPNLDQTIKHLQENPLIEKWIESGLSLHKDKDKCEFCGSSLNSDRLSNLHSHFSKDLKEHKQNIETLQKRVTDAKIQINLPVEAEITSQFREDFSSVKSEFVTAVEEFNSTVDALISVLQQKIDAPFKKLSATPLGDRVVQNVLVAVKKVNSIINKHNDIISSFKETKTASIEKLKFHHAQESYTRNSIADKKTKIDENTQKSSELSQRKKELIQEIDQLRATISMAQLGRERINNRLESLLGSESIQIQVSSYGGQEHFQLVRTNGIKAQNLSEGEKTAIAFSYFLTKLEELSADEFKKTIVYVDDPISSLDSNHIFQITAAICKVFFHQIRANGNDEWTTKCQQLFVSTHNFEFFSLLRELKPDTEGKKDAKARLYLIKKTGVSASNIINMPLSLSKYSSEYHFLFDTIHKFHISQDKTDYEVLMLLPNVVRRFIELYTYSRIPGTIDGTVDQRAELLFGSEKSKRILKVLHHFSHGNNIERLAQNNELIHDLEYVINDLFDFLETNDEKHWNALKKSIDLDRA
jgi:wobble nucleotide-excising tRNase